MKPNRSAILCAALTATVAASVRADVPKPTSPSPKFHVIAFYTGKNDLAHISFVNEAVAALLKIPCTHVSAAAERQAR